MDSVALKWVFQSAIVIEGRVTSGDNDWLSHCDIYPEILGFKNNLGTTKMAIHWKCSRYTFPLVGSDCPAIKKETIMKTNTDINKAFAHYTYFGIWDLELNVGPDPRKRVEFNANELFYNSAKKTSQQKLGRNNNCINKNKGTQGVFQLKKVCSICKTPGHNKKNLSPVGFAEAISDLHFAFIAL